MRLSSIILVVRRSLRCKPDEVVSVVAVCSRVYYLEEFPPSSNSNFEVSVFAPSSSSCHHYGTYLPLSLSPRHMVIVILIGYVLVKACVLEVTRSR